MGKKKILIIEDNENLRELYAFSLSKEGYEVLKAKDGDEGVRVALEERPHLILADIMMPGKNGHQMVKEIRKDAWGENAKIIYLTNKDDMMNVVHAKGLEAEDYIIKANTEMPELIQIVKKAID